MAQEKQSTSHLHTGIVLLIWDGHSLLQQEVTNIRKIGDEIDFVLANGRVIHGVMGDEKNMSDAGCNKWGHDGGHSVVEFVVNKSMWYHTGKTVTRFHPEWAKSRVVKAVNLGKNHLR